MDKYLQFFYASVASFVLSLGANAQEFDLLVAEDFNAVTIPAGWVSAVQDPALYPTSGPLASGGWEYGVTDYLTGAWNVPASIDASGFAISNDDQDPAPSGTDRSDDFLGVGFFDMTNYDSLTVLFDRFQNGQWGSVSFFYISNSAGAVIFPIPDNADWFEDGLTITNGEVLVTDPFVFDDEMVIGFIHNDNPDELADGNWGAGLAVDNVILAGWLPPCETAGLTQVPASPVSVVGGLNVISAAQNTGGEYSVITNVQGSTEYLIEHSGGAYVTVRTGSATGDVLASGFTPLTITTLSTDDLFLIWSDDQFCSSGAGTGTNLSFITGGAQVCAADAGALFAASGSDACLGDELLAGEAIAPSVPTGFEVLYVVTDGAGNVVAGPFATPTYTPLAEGTFVIHTLVFDPADQATILAQVPNGAQAVADLFEENGGLLCGSLDLTGAAFTVFDCPDNDDCEDAAPLECGVPVVGTNVNGSFDVQTLGETVWYTFQGNGQDVTFSTCDNADFDTFVLLWTGDCSALTNVAGNDDATGCTNNTSEFTYYMHPDTLYSVSVSGFAPGDAGTFTLSATCACPTGFDEGTLTATATTACLDGNGEAELSATVLASPIAPEGYEVLYVLTSGAGLDIEATNTDPEFTVTTGGDYTIHTLVYNPADAATILAETTGGGVAGLLSGNGGAPLCGVLDVAGSGTITVNAPDAGTITSNAALCYDGVTDVTISATPDGNQFVPAGYETGYALTEGGIVTQVGATASFDVSAVGDYTIHTFVYPTGFDPAVAVGQSAVVVNGLLVQGGGTVCAALDLAGATVTVVACPPVGINEALENSLSVYPNPSNGEFVVEIDGIEAMAQINVTDLAGKVIFTEAAVFNGNFRKEFNLDAATGTYLLQIVTEEGTVKRKLQVK